MVLNQVTFIDNNFNNDNIFFIGSVINNNKSDIRKVVLKIINNNKVNCQLIKHRRTSQYNVHKHFKKMNINVNVVKKNSNKINALKF